MLYICLNIDSQGCGCNPEHVHVIPVPYAGATGLHTLSRSFELHPLFNAIPKDVPCQGALSFSE